MQDPDIYKWDKYTLNLESSPFPSLYLFLYVCCLLRCLFFYLHRRVRCFFLWDWREARKEVINWVRGLLGTWKRRSWWRVLLSWSWWLDRQNDLLLSTRDNQGAHHFKKHIVICVQKVLLTVGNRVWLTDARKACESHRKEMTRHPMLISLVFSYCTTLWSHRKQDTILQP